MWKLTIEDDEGKQTQLPLAGEEYGVGRAESNSIRLTDRNVSRNHAGLRKNGQGWILKDIQSYNGTYVNGVRVIGEQPINSGDIIQLGDYRIELVDEVAVAPGAAPPPAAPPVHQRPNRLVVVIGPSPGAEFPLDKEHFTVGRSEDVDISINHSSVSRVHSELFALGNGRFEIVDKASANGIRINGVELKRGILEAGDALELGDVRLRFVGAGKIFRADMTQNLPAVAGFDMSRSVGPGSKSGLTPKIIGIAAAAGLALIIGVVALVATSGPPPATGAKKHRVNVENAKQLEEAMKLFGEKDVAGAHKKLLEIPEDVRPTENDDFNKIEAAWADMKFAEVEAATEAAKKKTILKEIMQTDTVPAPQRKKAAEMIGEIEKKEPPPTPTAHAGQPGQWNPGSAPAAAPPEPVQTATKVAPLPAQGPPNEEQLRRQLEPKVWGGRASLEEIRMLKAICSHMGDVQCRNRASEMYNKKKEQQ